MLALSGGSLFGCSVFPKKGTVTLVPALVLSVVIGMGAIGLMDTVVELVVI